MRENRFTQFAPNAGNIGGLLVMVVLFPLTAHHLMKQERITRDAASGVPEGKREYV